MEHTFTDGRTWVIEVKSAGVDTNFEGVHLLFDGADFNVSTPINAHAMLTDSGLRKIAVDDEFRYTLVSE